MRADSRQAATENENINPRSIECEFDHLFLVARCLTIGDAIAGSHDGLRYFPRWNVQGWQVGLRAEKMRADSRQAATENENINPRSLECEFDHWILVARCLTIGDAFSGSHDGLGYFSRWNV
jgi:hypothetical protein